MVKTKRVGKAHLSPDARKKLDDKIGLGIGVLLEVFLLLVAVFSKPIVSKIHAGFIVSQGVIIPAVLLSAAMWGLVEYVTPPGKDIWSVIDRIVPSFLVGAFLGGGMGYLFHFGTLVIRPAYSGNMYALLFLASVVIATLAILYNVYWAHSKGFRGQRGPHIHRGHYSESANSKSFRFLVLVVVIILFALVAPEIGGYIGHAAQTSPAAEYDSQSQIANVYSLKGSAIPFSSTSGVQTIENANTTSMYIMTSLSLSDLSDVSYLELNTSLTNKSTIIMGYGSGNGTDFTPVLYVSQGKIQVDPEMVTGPSNNYVMFEVQNATIPSFSISLKSFGSTSPIFSVIGSLDFTYLLSSIAILAGSFFSLGIFDIEIFRNKGVKSR